MSSIISLLLESIKSQNFFFECSNVSQKLSLTDKLIRDYVEETHTEVDRERILKN